jgi:hypothetical protein
MATLREGSRGVAVRAWQQFLLSQGFDPRGVDGIYGARTAAATRDFQESVGIRVDGIAGPVTQGIAATLGYRIVEDEGDEPLSDDLSVLGPIPPGINSGLRPASQATMLEVFGAPGGKSRECSPLTNATVRGLLVTREIGPIRVRGLEPAVDVVERVLERVRNTHPSLHGQIGTAGMLCCRRVRGGRNFSNHSWGTAIDIKINGVLDDVNDDLCQRGLSMLAPFFHEERFYWGAAFPREDAMHFEASDQLVHDWRANGVV